MALGGFFHFLFLQLFLEQFEGLFKSLSIDLQANDKWLRWDIGLALTAIFLKAACIVRHHFYRIAERSALWGFAYFHIPAFLALLALVKLFVHLPLLVIDVNINTFILICINYL